MTKLTAKIHIFTIARTISARFMLFFIFSETKFLFIVHIFLKKTLTLQLGNFNTEYIKLFVLWLKQSTSSSQVA